MALTAVVAAFMGGLAGGSAFFGWRIRSGSHPVRLYVLLEAGVALVALAFPLQLALVTTLSIQAARLLPGGSMALGLVRFALAALAVTPATFLMGGTLPAMVAVASRRAGSLARDAGLLYAVNTAGAVCGAALAGFVLIEQAGTLETTWIAAAGNLVVAVAALGLTAAPADQRDEAASGGAGPRDLLIAYALAGAAALAMQVVWTRALVFFAGSTTYAFSLMLIVFLGGLAVGTAIASPFAGRLRAPAAAFAGIQALLAVTAVASLPVLRLTAPVLDGAWPPDRNWATLLANGFAKAVVVMGLPTLLMGMAFPLAVRLARGEAAGTPVGSDVGGAQSGGTLGRLYAWNTVGGIGGVTLAGLVLIPLAGVTGTLALAAATCVAAGLLVVRSRVAGAVPARVALGIAAVCCLLAGRGGPSLHVPAGSERLIFYEEGMAATISVLQEVTGTRTIFIDRVPVAGTDAIMLTDQKSLAHVPLLLHPAARRVLTVGFGSGGASWSFSRYRSLERIDAVEIDPSVFHAAPHLEASNHGVWRDPRFHLILEDARNYLASTDAAYDVISTDCTDLRYKTNANLYTIDYFRLVRDRLRPGGIVTVWMPLGGLGGDTFRMALRTFRDVFPHSTVWYMTNQPTHYLLLVGSDRAIQPDVTAMADGLRDESVRSDLAEIRLDDPRKLAASLLLDEQETARLAGDGPLNSDRHPLLEFEAPRLAYRDALAANLRATAAARVRTAGLGRWRGKPGDVEALVPYVAATPALVEGHARYQSGTFDYAGALRLYRAAAATSPDDGSIQPLITDVVRTREVWLGEFAARTAAGSRDVRDWLAFATLLRQAGRLDEAADAGRRATALTPSSGEPWVRLAATLAAAGDRTSAVETLERARSLVPTDPVLLADLGAAYNELERFDDAVAVLRASLVLAPSAEAHNNLGVSLNGLKRPADAAHEFRLALALNPASPEAWFNLGVAYVTSGNPDEARLAYAQGLALAPREPRALFNLALIEAGAGRWAETLRLLRTAADEAPTAPEVQNELGRVYLQVRQPALAEEAFLRAQASDPASAAIAENLRLARQMRGASSGR